MSKIVGEVAIEVGADIGPLTREMNRGASAVSGFGNRTRALGRNMQDFGRRVTEVGKVMSIVSGAIAAGAAAAFALASSTAKAGDEIAKSARQAGVSGEFFQEMAFAIGQVTNLTQGELTNALTLLNRKLGEAQQGSASAVRAFEAIGISAEELASGTVNTERAFEKMVETLESTTDPAIAAAISTALMGRSGAALGAQLAGGAGAVDSLRERARELGIVMSGDALDASEKFNDKMGELRDAFGALRVQIGSKLLPIFVNQLIPVMMDKVLPAISKVVDKVGNAIDAFTNLPAPVQEAAGIIAAAFAVGGPALLAIGGTIALLGKMVALLGPAGPFVAAVGAAALAWNLWGKDLNEFLNKSLGPIAPAIKVLFGPLGMLVNIVEGLTAAWDRLVAAMEAVVETFRKVSNVLGSAASVGGPAVTATQGPGAGVQNDFSGEGAAWRGMGGDMGTGLIEGLGASIDAQEQQLRDVIDRIPAIAREQLDIQSPSRVFHGIGEQIGAGLAEGIISTQALVAEATAAIGQQAEMTAGQFASSILGSMKTMFEGSKPIAAAQALVNTYLGISEALKLPFPANLAAAAKVAAQGFAAVRGIRGASMGGGGGGGRAAGGGGGRAPAQSPGTMVNVNLTGGNMFGRDQVRDFISLINKEIESGARITGIRAT